MAFLVTLTGRSVNGYPSGAPVGACDNMAPNHGVVAGQTSTAPYQLTVSKLVFGCKETLKLTLNSSTSDQLKGYLCQARTDLTKNVTTGTLKAINGGNNKCDGNGSVTHMSNVSKSAVEFEWTASEYHGSVAVYFVITGKLDGSMNRINGKLDVSMNRINGKLDGSMNRINGKLEHVMMKVNGSTTKT
ncbi:putative ferric-chelate reductase 1 [Dreissena polymorpha]|uniref:putative ferric-chelate reductase 1 n=1 Tax=Dreissena polymorpha TaxID=45954 RepID=UPI002264A6C5|nr:putative ferric-chelate reductase 1 [Dreissena polymorpha]